MIQMLSNGNINFEGLEIAVVNSPGMNGAQGRLTLTAPVLNKECDGMIEFFEDPLTILELEIIFDAVIISKRVWIAYDCMSETGENPTGSIPVLFADYECRSRDLFAQNFRAKTTRNIHLIDSNDIIEMGLSQGKYTADIFMSCTTDQIPAFTNSAFQTNISMIFLDNQGDLASFTIRKVIPFIEKTISEVAIPREYKVVFEHHVIGMGQAGESIAIMSTPCGLKVWDKTYSISECAPEVIQYNTEIWDDYAAANIFKTLVRTTFANGDHFYYPIYEEGSDRFRMRQVARSAKRSIFGDRMSYHVPECVAIRFVRKPYLKMQVSPAVGVFDYRYYRSFKIHYNTRFIELEEYTYTDEIKSLAQDLRLPKIIVKVDRDIYDNFYNALPHGIDPKIVGGWAWLADEIHTSHIQYDTRYELLVSNMQELIIGYW